MNSQGSVVMELPSSASATVRVPSEDDDCEVAVVDEFVDGPAQHVSSSGVVVKTSMIPDGLMD
jgi:hypothetical protein